MKTITQVRESFWDNHSRFSGDYRKTYRQNRYNATIRTAFVDWVDFLSKEGLITEKLANRVTL